MDYIKIGSFIESERKAKKLTQAKLAEKLFVSEKTISKWENGNGIPDTTTLPKLCEIFGITLNELLNGERISMENYTNKAEEKLLDMQKAKEESDKRLLLAECFVGFGASLYLFSMVFIASFVEMPTWLRILLIAIGVVQFFVACFFALRIEQKAGYYECAKCHHKYVPTYNQALWAMHMGRTRYFKCPKCGQKSWSKKVLK